MRGSESVGCACPCLLNIPSWKLCKGVGWVREARWGGWCMLAFLRYSTTSLEASMHFVFVQRSCLRFDREYCAMSRSKVHTHHGNCIMDQCFVFSVWRWSLHSRDSSGRSVWCLYDRTYVGEGTSLFGVRARFSNSRFKQKKSCSRNCVAFSNQFVRPTDLMREWSFGPSKCFSPGYRGCRIPVSQTGLNAVPRGSKRTVPFRQAFN